MATEEMSIETAREFLTDLALPITGPPFDGENFKSQRPDIRSSLLLRTLLTSGASLKIVSKQGLELAEAPLQFGLESSKPPVEAGTSETTIPEPSTQENTIVAFDKTKDQAQAVGSAIMTFQIGVDAIVRDAIVNSMLLGQLYADSKVDIEQSPKAWFDAYMDVLKHAGWVISGLTLTEYREDRQGAEVHEAITALLAASLGPNPAALVLVKNVIEALGQMNEDSPWITVFDRRSKRQKYADFQVGLATVEGDLVVVHLAIVLIDGISDHVQVLFFKWQEARASLYAKSQKAILSRESLLELAPVVRSKTSPVAHEFFGPIATFKPSSAEDPTKGPVSKLRLAALHVDTDASRATDAFVADFRVADAALALHQDKSIKYVNARSGLHLRTGPGTEFDKIKLLPFGTKLWCLNIADSWTMVDLLADGGADGYVSSGYLVDRPPSSPPPGEDSIPASSISDASLIPNLVNLGNDSNALKMAAELGRSVLPHYPTNGCAVHLSALLCKAGINIPVTYGAGALASLLERKRGWEQVNVGDQKPGDVGVTFDNDPTPKGADHIYLVVERIDDDRMLIADNQNDGANATHERFASGRGKTPTDYFLRAS